MTGLDGDRRGNPARAPRVALLIASLQQGGAERAAAGLLGGLVDAGVDASLICVDRNREMPLATDPERAERLTRRIHGLGLSDIRRGTVAKTLAAPRRWLALQRALGRLEPDVVVSFVERANLLNLLSPRSRRRILSIRSHPSRLLASKTPLKRWLVVVGYRALLRRADRVVYVSREASADFEARFPAAAGRGTVIYNLCDAEQVRTLGRRPLPDAAAGFFDVPTLVSVGRLNPEKGHRHLLRAFRELCARGVPGRLAVVGRGPLERDLADLTDGLGLKERVLLAGFQPNPQAWIARARGFVLPSLWEGFPNTLLEAMALGVPVIASDCSSGPRELLDPASDPFRKTREVDFASAGTLVPAPGGEHRAAGDPATREEVLLADAMERLLRDDALHASQAAASRLRSDDFVPARIVPRWIRLFEELR